MHSTMEPEQQMAIVLDPKIHILHVRTQKIWIQQLARCNLLASLSYPETSSSTLVWLAGLYDPLDFSLLLATGTAGEVRCFATK